MFKFLRKRKQNKTQRGAYEDYISRLESELPKSQQEILKSARDAGRKKR